MTEESIEKALSTSLYVLLVFSIIDFILYIVFESAILTVMAHAMSVCLLLKYRLKLDFIKFTETFAFFSDLLIIYLYGYALVSPFASLISIILISSKKEKHLNKLKMDLNKIISSNRNDLEND